MSEVVVSISNILSFTAGAVMMIIVWFYSEHDERRQYRKGYKDGFYDGQKGKENETF